MARILICVLATTMLWMFLDNRVNACSCQPEHPQVLYCKSDFVIKALVGKARMVELKENGEYKRVHHKGKPEKEDKTDAGSGLGEKIKTDGEIEGPDGHITNILDESGSEQPDEDTVLVVERVQPFPLSGGHKPNSHPLYSSPRPGIRKSHQKNLLPRRHRRTALRAKKIKPRGFRHPFFVVGGPPGAPSVQATPNKRFMMQYKISIVKTFKGLQNVTKQQRAYMYTPPHPLCNMRLTTDRSPFIIMGKMQHGVMMIRECDYKVDLGKLSNVESKNLIRNMRFRFENGCKNCHVKICNRGGCGPESDRQPFQCKWSEWWTVQTTGASQFACIPSKAGKCHWYNGGNKHAKQGDLSLSSSR